MSVTRTRLCTVRYRFKWKWSLDMISWYRQVLSLVYGLGVMLIALWAINQGQGPWMILGVVGDTIEIQIWSLDEPETQQLQSDVVDILSQYLDDNNIRTPYSDLAPTGTDDFREQTSATHTDHYVMSVEVGTRGLQDTQKLA